jgi:hypothetical protein
MSFFGFDTTLPEHKGQQQQQPQQHQQQPRFATNDSTSFGGGFPQQEEDDLATFTWGEGASTNLLEGGDEMNDETFGDSGNGGMSLLQYGTGAWLTGRTRLPMVSSGTC